MTTRPGYAWDEATSQWIEIASAVAESPVYYQATPPTSAPTGSIWVDSDAFVPSIDSAQMLRWRKTMTGGQTSLSGTDDSGLPLSYTPGYEQLYINGVLQVRGQDYVATTGTTVTGLTALVANDVVEVFSVVARAVGDVYTQAQSDSKYQAKSDVGLVLVKPTSVTSGGTLNANGSISVGSAVTSVVVEGAFSVAYDNYEILWSGGTMASSSGDSQLQLRLNGSSVNYTTYLRYTNGTTMSVASQTTSQFMWIGGGSTGSGLMQVKLYAPFLPVHTRMDSNTYNSWGNVFLGSSNGVHTVSSSYSGFSVFVSGTGSMTGGSIRIYGYNNGV